MFEKRNFSMFEKEKDKDQAGGSPVIISDYPFFCVLTEIEGSPLHNDNSEWPFHSNASEWPLSEEIVVPPSHGDNNREEYWKVEVIRRVPSGADLVRKKIIEDEELVSYACKIIEEYNVHALACISLMFASPAGRLKTLLATTKYLMFLRDLKKKELKK